MSSVAGERFQQSIADVHRRLQNTPASHSGMPVRKDGWTRSQIVGHLIDSCINNHYRFVRAMLERGYEGPRYDQLGWVAAHRYVELAWNELVDLWAAHNTALALVVSNLPHEALQFPCEVAGEKVTLGFLIDDYVTHLNHHLAQIENGEKPFHAHDFAAAWIADWNSHDLERILRHYSDDIVFRSPFVAKLTGDPSGTLQGKTALRAYFERGLQAYPELRFHLLTVLTGVNACTLHYRSVAGRVAAETMRFSGQHLVTEADSTYSWDIRRIDAASIEANVDGLSNLLIDSVNQGASVGFLPPLHKSNADAYWLNLVPALQAGALLFCAFNGDQIIGSVQLHPSPKENGSHRAEVAKLLVHSGHRRQGLGQALMHAIELESRQSGRTLLVLDTKCGDAAEQLYKRLGYSLAGRMPEYALSAPNQYLDTAFYYKHLSAPPLR